MKIALTSVFVDDPTKAFEFYTQVLGLVERLYMPEAQLAIVVSPEDPGGTGLLLEPSDNPIGKSYQEALYSQGLPAIVLGVEDVQKEYDRANKQRVGHTGGVGRHLRQFYSATSNLMSVNSYEASCNFITLILILYGYAIEIIYRLLCNTSIASVTPSPSTHFIRPSASSSFSSGI